MGGSGGTNGPTVEAPRVTFLAGRGLQGTSRGSHPAVSSNLPISLEARARRFIRDDSVVRPIFLVHYHHCGLQSSS